MGDLLQTGVAWLASQLQDHVSRTVVYHRGFATVTLQATVGKTLLKLMDEMGSVIMEWTDRDYILQAQDLILDSLPVIPERGDQIRETVGSVVHTYEVRTPGNEPLWRWMDPARLLMRIHTKEVMSL